MLVPKRKHTEWSRTVFRCEERRNEKRKGHKSYLMRGNKVADKEENGHDNVLCDGNDVRAGDLRASPSINLLDRTN